MKHLEIHACIKANITLNNSFIPQVIYILWFCLQYNIKNLVWRIQIKTTRNTAKSMLRTNTTFSRTDFLC